MDATPVLSAGDRPPPGGLWSAIVLAGTRTERDALASSFGITMKALVPICGEPMISHVVRTLAACPSIGRILILAQQPESLLTGDLAWMAEAPRISCAASDSGIAQSLIRIAGTDAAPWPVLVTTADHPLLTIEMVEYFIRESRESDVSIAVVERSLLLDRYPQSRRTWLRFRGGAYTGANLFTAGTEGALAGLKILASAERNRKNQLKLLWRFGPLLALGAVARLCSLQGTVARGGRRLGLRAKAVPLPFAEAGIDVDRLEDHRLADRILCDRAAMAPA